MNKSLHNDRGPIQQEAITMINLYAFNIRTPMIYRANSGRRNSSRMILDLNTLLLRVDRKFRQEIKKETADLNNTIDQMDLTNIYYWTIWT